MSQSRDWYHVTSRKDGKWAVVREGADKAIALLDTQTEAAACARKLAKNAGGELLVHDRQNRIGVRSSYMKDHCPPPG